ncbi:hypothetical protein BESB_035750 [Besnoitia besnoiti]|uniref:Bromo domain-containing protein n=1 Tax=Besnoitia besnoiti TaxID=94643 RepID=A0A2A9MMU2_BESBE|nr:hypothetical protein BESB_035750 [Besnoitia besnoiti]PFH37117.1 hypothetical protein BESB_035750 [Besnoitia besnoiti]
MGEELKLREQRIDVSVEDFREKIVYGSTSLCIEVGAGAATAVAAALEASEQEEQARARRDGKREESAALKPVVLPLQVPPACVVTGIWVDDLPAVFSVPPCGEDEDSFRLSSLLGDEDGVHFDLLTLRLRAARETVRHDGERQLLVQLPNKTARRFQSRARQRLRISVDFKLVNPTHRRSSLYFSEHWLRPPQGSYRLYRLLLSSQAPASLPWFPTLPAAAYSAPPPDAAAPQKPAQGSKSAKDGPSACSRCRWIVSLQVPEGNVGVAPGRLVQRARVWRPRRSNAADEPARALGGGAEGVAGAAVPSPVEAAEKLRFERFLFVVEPPPKKASVPESGKAARSSSAHVPLLPPQVGLFAGPFVALDGNSQEAVAYPVTAASIGLAMQQTPLKKTKATDSAFAFFDGEEPRGDGDDAQKAEEDARDAEKADEARDDDEEEDDNREKNPDGDAGAESGGDDDNDSLVSGVRSETHPSSAPAPPPAAGEAQGAGVCAPTGCQGAEAEDVEPEGDKDASGQDDGATSASQEAKGVDVESAESERLANVPVVTYVTLKGFENLISPTTATIPLCFRVYSRAFASPSPFPSLLFLFLPVAVEGGQSWALPSVSSLDAAATAETSDEASRGLTEVADTSAADTAIGADLNKGQLPQFYIFRNLLVFPFDLLHTEEQVGVDESCYAARILIAEGLASAWLDIFTFFWCCSDQKKQIDGFSIFLGTVKLLVDLFIQANFGSVELKVRRWERLLRYVALVEAGCEEFPLDAGSLSASAPLAQASVSTLVPGVSQLHFSEIYHLKSSIAFHALDRLLASHSLLPRQFFFQFLMRSYIPLLGRKREPPNTDRFWKKLLFQVTLQYINYWNRRPVNSQGGRQRLRLKEKKKKTWGVAALGLQVDGEERVVDVNPQDHDVLTQLEEALVSFRSAFISGTGCPQLTLSFIIQLQRKGSSMDFFNFYLDLLSLQPPASLATSLALPRAFARLQKSVEKRRARGRETAAELQAAEALASFFFTRRDPDRRGGDDEALEPKARAGGAGGRPSRPKRREQERERDAAEEERRPSFFRADLAGLAAFNLWQAYEICRVRQQAGVDVLSAAQDASPLSSWELLLQRSLFPTLKLAHAASPPPVSAAFLSRSFCWSEQQTQEFFARLVFAFCVPPGADGDRGKAPQGLKVDGGQPAAQGCDDMRGRAASPEGASPCAAVFFSTLAAASSSSRAAGSPSPAGFLAQVLSVSLPRVRDAASFLLLSPGASLSALLYLPQRVYDPVDVVGRDGNFILGFGYSGETPAVFNAGRGGLWAATREALKTLQRKGERRRRSAGRRRRKFGKGEREEERDLERDDDDDSEEEDLDGKKRRRRREKEEDDDALEPLGLDGGKAAGELGEGDEERRRDALGAEGAWDEEGITEEKFAAVCVDSETAPPTLPVVTTGGLPFWAVLLHQREHLSRLRFRLLAHATAARGGTARSAFSPSFFASAARGKDDALLLSPANLGALLCASVGYEKYWLPALCLQVVEDDGIRTSIVRLREGVLPLRFALDPRAERGRKKVALRGDRALHGTSSNKLMMKAADAAAAATEAPAAAAAAASGVSAVEGVSPGGATACGADGPGAGGRAGGGFAGADQIRFTGELSASDRGLIEALKRCVVAKHPSLLSLDNRSLVAKINSKTKLPVLWLRADPMQVWIGRIRRCQSGSMWEQQLLNDVNIYAQLEAALALGRFRAGDDVLGTLSDPPQGSAAALPHHLPRGERGELAANFLAGADALARDAVQALSRALASHRWHPFLRSRVAYALCFLHNRVRSEQLAVWSAFVAYMHTFHYDNLGEEDRIQHAAARMSLLNAGGGGEASASPMLQRAFSPASAEDGRGAYGDRAALAGSPTPQGGEGMGGTFFRIGEVAASTPEMRFLRHFYAAVSLLRDADGLTRPEAIEMLLQPLVSTNTGGSSPSESQVSGLPAASTAETEQEDEAEAEGSASSPLGRNGEAPRSSKEKETHDKGAKTASVDLLWFIASVVDCFGNIKCPYTPYPAYAETKHPYFSFLYEQHNPLASSAAMRNGESLRGREEARSEAVRDERSAEGTHAGQYGPAAASPPRLLGDAACKCADLGLGFFLSAVLSRASPTHSAFASDAEWESFVTRNARGVEVAWLNLWRVFRLDSVRSLASPRHAISCAFLRTISRQPTLRDLARRRLLRVPFSPFSRLRREGSATVAGASPSAPRALVPQLLLFLSGEKGAASRKTALLSQIDDRHRDLWSSGEETERDEEPVEELEEQTPLDFLIFVPLRTHDIYLKEKAYSAYELHYAYHDFAVHREAIRAQLLVCCEGAVRVYRVPLTSPPSAKGRSSSRASASAAASSDSSVRTKREAESGRGADGGADRGWAPSERGVQDAWSRRESQIREQRRNLGGFNEAYTLVSKFVSPEEQTKRAQLGLGIYTALQCAVEMERLLRHDEARLPITIWEVFVEVLEELRVRSPTLFLPFSTHLVELHSGTCPPPLQAPRETESSAASSQTAPGVSTPCASRGVSFCSDAAGAHRPAFCGALGCLGPACSPLIPATPLPPSLRLALSGEAEGAASSAASLSARLQQQALLQDHVISVALTVSQAASAYLSCYLASEARAAAAGNRAAFAQKLGYAQRVHAFLFGVDLPFAMHPGPAQLARYACGAACSADPAESVSAAAAAWAPSDGASPLWSSAPRPGAAAGVAAFCLTPEPGGDEAATSPAPEKLIRLAGAGELCAVDDDAAAEYALCLQAGSRQRKMWTFKRKYMDNAQHTAHWVDVAIEAVGALMEMPEAVWFVPDPETTVNEYRAVIQEPMWLKKVQAKLKARLYKLPYHFKQDVALIFRNARTFNRPEDRPYRDCCVVEQKFNRLWGCINQAFQRAAAKSQKTGSDLAAQRQTVGHSASAYADGASTVGAGSYPQSHVHSQPPQMSYEQQLLASTLTVNGTLAGGGLGMHAPREYGDAGGVGVPSLGAPLHVPDAHAEALAGAVFYGQPAHLGEDGLQYGFMPPGMPPSRPTTDC